MSLLIEAMESCTLINKVREEDGYGGFTTEWKDGPSFNAAFSFDTSLTARIASKQGVNDVYTITTEKSVTLSYGDVLRRSSDNLTYRVTSNGKDKTTPDSAMLNMRVVNAERWDIPANGEEDGGNNEQSTSD